MLALVAHGLTDTEIAAALFVGHRTAESHVSAVLAKLGVETCAGVGNIGGRNRSVLTASALRRDRNIGR